MKNKLLLWGALITLVLLWLPVTAMADEPVGVAYRGHIQDRGDYPLDGSWIDSPEIIGTTGQSKRIEGFEIKLTGDIPADLQNGLELRYNVHVQNKGWLYDENDCSDWLKDGAYAGTRGESLRIEAVKLVLTDKEGQPLSGYSVQYRGHVQNVGDLPVDDSQWLADGAQLGTVGSSQRLEALLVQVVKTGTAPVEPAEPVVYDAAGTYGPEQGSVTIAGDVIVGADGVTLQNLVIAGNLTISEAVGDGNVTLNNVTVKGDTFVRGGGKNSIHLNGGQYSRIVMEKTASGAVRIVATGVDGLDVVVAEDASGEEIILEGAFASVTVNAPNMVVTTQGNTTTIGTMTVGANAGGSTLNLASGTTVTDLVLDGKAAVKGQGTVTKAEVKADGVVFDKKPGAYTVEPEVVIPPVFPPEGGGSSGGYTPPAPVAVTGVSLNKTALALDVQGTETLIATVIPTNAANKAVSFSSNNQAVATVDASTGLVTAVAVGTAKITVTTADGGKQASCDVTVNPIVVTGVSLTPQPLNLVYDDTAILTATVAPANATNPGITWTSSDPLVATVDQSGTVKAAHAGTAEITASSQADSTIKATSVVTVQGRLSIYDFKAVAGLEVGNYVAMLLEGDTFIFGNYDFDFNAGITGLGLSPSTSDSVHRVFDLTNIAKPGTLTLQATGLTSGISSNIVSVTVPEPVVASVSLNKSSADLIIGNTLSLTATVLPADAVNRIVSWTSDAEGVATVDGNGVVSPVAPGPAVITARTANGVEDTCSVTVKPVIETSVTSEGVTITKYNGGTEPLVIPAEINSQPVIAIANGAFARTVAQVESGDIGPSSVQIPATVKSIGNQAFSSCRGMTSLTFAGSSELTAIGDRAFQGCLKLQSVAIPSTVTSIGESAFLQCLAMTSLDLGSVTSIGASAFYECNALTNLTIPNTVTSIGNQAFWCCQGLKTVTFQGGATSTQTLAGTTFWECKALETVSFEPDTKIESLSANTFLGCSGLQRVTFSDALKTMGNNAFNGCPATLVLRFYGDAPNNDTSAIPAGTTIEYLTGKANFVPARFPNCTIQTFTP